MGLKGKSTPLAWMSQATMLYDQPLEIKNNNLEPTSSYIIRAAYTGRFSSKIKMDLWRKERGSQVAEI